MHPATEQAATPKDSGTPQPADSQEQSKDQTELEGEPATDTPSIMLTTPVEVGSEGDHTLTASEPLRDSGSTPPGDEGEFGDFQVAETVSDGQATAVNQQLEEPPQQVTLSINS